MKASSPDERTVIVRHDGNVTTIVFNRPAALNSADKAMSQQLASVAATIADWESKVIVLRGAGAAFMAGGDVHEMAAFDDPVRELDAIIGHVHQFSLALARARQPVIAALHGAAAGYGLSLAISCDFVICAEDAALSFAYRRLGTTADGGPTYILPRLLGTARAAELLLLRDRIEPAEAKAIGMIGFVVPTDQFDRKLDEVVTQLLRNSPPATSAIKQLVRGDLGAFESALEAERRSFLRCAAGADFAEGVRSFVEKRSPDFGRTWTGVTP